jgi:hypothetical protein
MNLFVEYLSKGRKRGRNIFDHHALRREVVRQFDKARQQTIAIVIEPPFSTR